MRVDRFRIHTVPSTIVALTLTLLGVAATRSEPATKLNAPPVSGGDVLDTFQVSPDRARIVYRADQDVNDRTELFSAQLHTRSHDMQANLAIEEAQLVASVQREDASSTSARFHS